MKAVLDAVCMVILLALIVMQPVEYIRAAVYYAAEFAGVEVEA